MILLPLNREGGQLRLTSEDSALITKVRAAKEYTPTVEELQNQLGLDRAPDMAPEHVSDVRQGELYAPDDKMAPKNASVDERQGELYAPDAKVAPKNASVDDNSSNTPKGVSADGNTSPDSPITPVGEDKAEILPDINAEKSARAEISPDNSTPMDEDCYAAEEGETPLLAKNNFYSGMNSNPTEWELVEAGRELYKLNWNITYTDEDKRNFLLLPEGIRTMITAGDVDTEPEKFSNIKNVIKSGDRDALRMIVKGLLVEETIFDKLSATEDLPTQQLSLEYKGLATDENEGLVLYMSKHLPESVTGTEIDSALNAMLEKFKFQYGDRALKRQMLSMESDLSSEETRYLIPIELKALMEIVIHFIVLMANQTAISKSKAANANNRNRVVTYSGLKRDHDAIEGGPQGEKLSRDERLQLASDIRKKMHYAFKQLLSELLVRVSTLGRPLAHTTTAGKFCNQSVALPGNGTTAAKYMLVFTRIASGQKYNMGLGAATNVKTLHQSYRLGMELMFGVQHAVRNSQDPTGLVCGLDGLYKSGMIDSGHFPETTVHDEISGLVELSVEKLFSTSDGFDEQIWQAKVDTFLEDAKFATGEFVTMCNRKEINLPETWAKIAIIPDYHVWTEPAPHPENTHESHQCTGGKPGRGRGRQSAGRGAEGGGRVNRFYKERRDNDATNDFGVPNSSFVPVHTRKSVKPYGRGRGGTPPAQSRENGPFGRGGRSQGNWYASLKY